MRSHRQRRPQRGVQYCSAWREFGSLGRIQAEADKTRDADAQENSRGGLLRIYAWGDRGKSRRWKQCSAQIDEPRNPHLKRHRRLGGGECHCSGQTLRGQCLDLDFLRGKAHGSVDDLFEFLNRICGGCQKLRPNTSNTPAKVHQSQHR